MGSLPEDPVALMNEHFPHLSSHEWAAFERMRAVIGEAAVINLLRPASSEDQKNAAVSFMHHEIMSSQKQLAILLPRSTRCRWSSTYLRTAAGRTNLSQDGSSSWMQLSLQDYYGTLRNKCCSRCPSSRVARRAGRTESAWLIQTASPATTTSSWS